MMAEFIKGMDISTLLEQEACGARYFDNGKEGDMLEFGGLLGSGPVMPVNNKSAEKFISRGGRLPAPMHSIKN